MEMSKIPIPIPKTTLLLFVFVLLSIPFVVTPQLPNTEQSVLLGLKQQWGNPPSMESWNSSSSPCDWPEILCYDGLVTGIILRDKNITAKIPITICHLKNLTVLNLAWNYIPGEFPKVLYNCSKLQHLDLSQNYFVGQIPEDIDNMSKLQFLSLGGNNFSGDIPAAISRLPDLKTLTLFGNLLNGSVPKEIGNLSNLEVLEMGYNGLLLPSLIPPEFGNLKKLKYVWMTQMNLMGEIPDNFYTLWNLEHFDLSMNNLVGEIPSGLFLLKNLTKLYLFHNRLTGKIPRKIKALRLNDIDISINNLIGSIPEEFGKLKNLTRLRLYSNQLTGEIPASLGLIPTLKEFRVFSNKLNGTLPLDFGLHSKLEDFDVSNNKLSGQLPQNLCFNGALLGVIAFSNNLRGELPKGLGDCDTLSTVQLYNNNFSGEVPLSLWTALNLSTLMLSDNSFSGQLPNKLAWNMSRLELSNNKFSGKIPKGVSTWSSLIVFKASRNLFSGQIPIELTSLSQLATLFLDDNRLSGPLPSKILSWKSLNTLNLSRNELEGQIPTAFASLHNLLYLDLAGNQLSGEISPQLGNLKLNFLNLSSNKLFGKIPDEFDNLVYETSFLDNSNLCSDTQNLNLPTCDKNQHETKKLSTKILVIILVPAITIFLATIALTFYVVRKLRTKTHKEDLVSWKLTSFQRLNFAKYNVLSNLNENNLVGSGGSGKVYRIDTNSLDGFVAVKRILNNRKWDEKLEKEFLAEVEILGTMRHSNIVKLLCCISSENSKLLVYEYMENQSLDMWLHSKRRRSNPGMGLAHYVVLDWPKRLEIAIGAAQGLCYMHHDCSPPIIHRDVKSSNILLDCQFKACIADFGLAKILNKHEDPNTMSALAGSFGYFAPEYAYTTNINEKVDVYSFGVVLLELTTGREPNNGEEKMNLAEWAWRYYSEEKSIPDVFDEDIKKSCFLEEMTAVFKLGLICTSTVHTTRPSMKEALQILRQYGPQKVSEVKKVGNEFDVSSLLGGVKYISSYKRSKKVTTVDEADLVYSI